MWFLASRCCPGSEPEENSKRNMAGNSHKLAPEPRVQMSTQLPGATQVAILWHYRCQFTNQKVFHFPVESSAAWRRMRDEVIAIDAFSIRVSRHALHTNRLQAMLRNSTARTQPRCPDTLSCWRSDVGVTHTNSSTFSSVEIRSARRRSSARFASSHF